MWQSPKPWFEMLTVDIKDGEIGFGVEGLAPWPARGCRIFHFITKLEVREAKLEVMFEESVVDSPGH